MTSAPAIETRDLVKEYGELRALDGLDLTVGAGEFYGLLGPNGAGKTTFINILVGLASKTAGEAAVFGHDVEAEYRQVRDAVGLSPQEFNVDRFFPVREVLAHKAGYHGIPEDEALERADDALRTVGIYDKRNVRFDWLSGGMKRRLLLARAIVTEPELLILDEPTAGVDVQLRRDLWDIITAMNEAGTTILLTTHYIEEAERLCDRVCILDRGRKVEEASPDALRGRGTDTLYVRLAEPPAAAPSFDIDTVEEVAVEDGQLVIRARAGGRTAPQVIRALDAAGHEVVDIDIARTSLEDVFVELTERRPGGGAAEPEVGAP